MASARHAEARFAREGGRRTGGDGRYEKTGGSGDGGPRGRRCCSARRLVSLPPSPAALAEGEGDGTIAGALHVHSNRSDGRRSPDEISAIAARAGLKFIVFTDHGDATRQPDPPRYLAGVLCLDGVEISTTGGHYLAFDMPASPYPLGGEPRDVIEDVHRLGGFGVVAHPDSPKPELRWREWTAPFDGIEIVNPDTSWRVHLREPQWQPKLRLARGAPGVSIQAGGGHRQPDRRINQCAREMGRDRATAPGGRACRRRRPRQARVEGGRPGRQSVFDRASQLRVVVPHAFGPRST